jgi:hypothetical protein
MQNKPRKWKRVKGERSLKLVIGDITLTYCSWNLDAVPEWAAYRDGKLIGGGSCLGGAREGKKKALEFVKGLGLEVQ